MINANEARCKVLCWEDGTYWVRKAMADIDTIINDESTYGQHCAQYYFEPHMSEKVDTQPLADKVVQYLKSLGYTANYKTRVCANEDVYHIMIQW